MATKAKTRAKTKPAEQAKKSVGRPTKYTEELADDICERIAKGESLMQICDSGTVDYSTVCRWLGERTTFHDKYAQARETQADFYADDIVRISDETSVEARHDGEEVTLDLSSTAVARNRLRVDARKWYASKLAPKKYGDKTTLAGDPENPMKVDVSLAVSFVKPNV